jgi:glutamate 5-kinase
MTVTISRLYNSYPDAQAAIKRLEAAGVDHGDISVLASNADGWYKDNQPAKSDTFPDRDLDGKDDRVEAAGPGAGVGAALGGTAGVLTGLGLMAIPGVGPIVAAGWLVSTLAGAAAGSAAGGVLGALTQAGVGKDEADIYAESLRRGGAVVSSRVPDADASRLQAVLDNSAVKVADRAALYRKSGWKTFDPTAAPYTAEQAKKERSLYNM